MRVRVLGPLEIRRDQEWHRISAAKQRTLLATLLVKAGQPVPVERLVDDLWTARPVSSAVNQVHGYVWRLRTALGDADGQLLRTQAAGYELSLQDGDLDATCFEAGVDQGLLALRDGSAERASALLVDALALWRGPAFGDVVSTSAIRAEVDRLGERRLSALESRIDADLCVGRHRDVVAELQELVETEPFRERFWAQLMLALYRCGRQGDALAAYRQVYRSLADQLGVGPHRSLQELHRQILASSPDLDAPRSEVRAYVGVPTPRQLPAGPADFTGRVTLLERLDALVPGGAREFHAPPVAALTGVGGIGTSALAVHWAHRAAERFPDGQLYADLRGQATGPREPVDVLREFLASLGYQPDHLPRDLDGCASRYRSELARRRVLVVLDNAATSAQVRPLLPGSPSCAVVVASRDELTGLVARNGARRLTLDSLRPDESLALLERMLGADRVEVDRAAATELARLCAHHPLALRIAATKLDTEAYAAVADLVAVLSRGRMQSLRIDAEPEASLAATLDLTYRRLAPEARALFRRCGGLPMTGLTAESVAARLGVRTTDAYRLLSQLASCHLVERRGQRTFRLTSLLHAYARWRAQADEDAAGDDATGRLLRPVRPA